MKLIFLDIDGVLNSCGDFIASAHREFNFQKWHSQGSRVISPDKLAILEALVLQVEEETKERPQLVLTSTWRNMFTNEQMQAKFLQRGWTLPMSVWHGQTEHSSSVLSSRADEVSAYLDSLPGTADIVILDDHDSGFTTDLRLCDSYVECSSFYGLSTLEANRVMRLLGCEEHFIVII